MKAYLFIEGEKRPPKPGDCFINGNGDVDLSVMHFTENRLVLTRHEIEIPEGATQFRYAVICDDPMCNRGQSIPIPRPKKVKRWWWNFEDDNAADGFSTSGPYTEEEVKADYPNAKWYHRIDETMIEVEE